MNHSAAWSTRRISGTRDIIVSGEGKNATARLGNFFFSQGKAANNATMQAFKAALENEYGSLGTHAFDTVLGSRSQLNKSLRACDIQQTLSKLVPIRENRFLGEVNRQIATSPKMLELSDNERMAVFQKLKDEPFKDVDLAACRTPEDLSAAAARRIDAAIDKLRKESDAGLHENTLGARKSVETAAGAKEPTGLRNYNINPRDLERLINGGTDKGTADAIKEIKRELFAQIRDAVMGVRDGDDFYLLSPIFKHFDERHIMKLDYNEGDRVFTKDAAHAGSFQRPERILTTRKPILGQIYRLQTAHSADSISAGAVTEALANDLTRIAGVPAQELEIVRGEYSDGHPKLMLQAKFADGYKDMEAGFIKDGRIVPPKGQSAEKLGKYKAFFLLTADRDAVGRRGQNKGFVNGKFFAIDPGHSLEGNGKYLEISDDFSFKDTYGSSTKPRFENFSVFDDDTRAAKFKGVLEMRELQKSGAFKKVFDDYRAAFNPNEDGISDAEKTLRNKIITDINAKEKEFNESINKLMRVSGMQLELHDDLKEFAPSVNRDDAIETLANLDNDHMNDVDKGSGPNRRLYLKCETFGVFVNTIHAKFSKKADSRTEEMKTRGYEFGDICESIAHGASLFGSKFTSKNAPGIRKENLPGNVEDKINELGRKLRKAGYRDFANAALKDVFDGGGVRRLIENLNNALVGLQDEEMFNALALVNETLREIRDVFENLNGEIENRMGNEVLVEPNDIYY